MILSTLTQDVQCKEFIEDASVSHLMQMHVTYFISTHYSYWF